MCKTVFAGETVRSKRKLRQGAVFAALLAAFVCVHDAKAAPKICDVKAFGARGDGQTRDTAAIQSAIDSCSHADGGGTVRFPAGTYVSAPLDWKSHTHLVLDAGAVLLGSPDMADYPVRSDATWRRVSLLHADHATDISISGEGIVDGNGHIWWDAKLKEKKEGRPEGVRPMLFDLTNSKQISFRGITIQNSPQYNIMATLCDGLTVSHVKILNPGKTAPNTDGIDPISTSNVLIEHTLIDTGDDNVAIKSGLVERGDPDVPSTNITVRDCELRNGHGLSIGSETAGGVRNVIVENVTFQGTRQGVRIKSARGRGNDIGGFVFRNIRMTDVETPIQITAYYTGGMQGDTAQPVTGHTPKFHDITIENLQAAGAKYAATIYGLPESPIKNVTLHHVKIHATYGMAMQYADVVEQDVDITADQGPALIKGPGVNVVSR